MSPDTDSLADELKDIFAQEFGITDFADGELYEIGRLLEVYGETIYRHYLEQENM